MKLSTSIPLPDDLLKQHLCCGDTICFTTDGLDWQDVEKQVERLGFGDTYFVSAIRGRRIGPSTISVKSVKVTRLLRTTSA